MKRISILKTKKTSISVFYPPIQNTKKWEYRTILDIYRLILSNDNLKVKTESVRSQFQKSGLKLQLLPSATFGGVFNERTESSRSSTSNLLCIDIDDLGEKLDWVKKRINAIDDFVLMSFVSPSGNGLKVIVPIDEQLYSFKDWYYSISCYLSEKIKLDLKYFDLKCAHASRCHLLCHDPEVFINPLLLKK